MFDIYVLAASALFALKAKVVKLFTNEEGAVDIVAIVVLIGVAVLLAIVFKDQIGNLVSTLLEQIGGKASNVVNQEIGG